MVGVAITLLSAYDMVVLLKSEALVVRPRLAIDDSAALWRGRTTPTRDPRLALHADPRGCH